MKRIIFITVIACLAVFSAQAQTARGPVRNAVFTAKPAEGNNGYEVQITLKYRFQLCAGDITLDGFRTRHEPLAYWYNGKRYTEPEIKGGCKFKTGKSDLYPNLDFTADILNEFTGRKIGAGKWIWVNLPDWGGCLGDYGAGGFKYPTAGISGNVQDYIKGMISFLQLKNIKPKDAPNRDYDIEKCIEPKKEEPKKEEKPKDDCVEINGVCWATKNLGANSPQEKGNYYTWQQAQTACPAGWRLPTKRELESLIASGSVWKESGREFANGKLFLPDGWVRIAGGTAVTGQGAYWSSDNSCSPRGYALHFGKTENPYTHCSGTDDYYFHIRLVKDDKQ